MNNTWYRWQNGVLELKVRVQPRAKRQEVAAIGGDALRIKLKAPPVDGKANDKLIRFLANAFNVPRSRVVLVRGAHNRWKTLRIEAPQRIPKYLAGELALPES